MSQELYKAEILPIRDKLYHIAKKMLSDEDEAEDAIQEVLLKLWHTKELLIKYDNLAAFATTVTKNHCLDRIKVINRTESLNQAHNAFETYDNPYKLIEKKNTVELIQKIISTLPALQQTIIRMKDIEEYEIAEIAEITGSNTEAIRVNLSRARKKVREEFTKLTK